MITRLTTTISQRSMVIIGITITIVMTLSLAIGVMAGLGHNYRVLIIGSLPIIVAAIIFVLRRFDIAVLSIPLTAWIAVYDIPAGNYSRVPVSLIATLGLCAIWITSMIIRHQWRLASTPLNRPLIVFGIICIVSLVWGIIWRDPILLMERVGGDRFLIVQFASLLSFLGSIGSALLIGNFVQTSGRLKFILGLFLVLGGISTMLLIFKISPFPLNPHGLGGLWSTISAYALALFHPRLRLRWRILLIGLVLIQMYLAIVINITWKSGWVPTTIGLFIVTWLRSRHAFFILLMTVIIALVLNSELVMQVVNDELEEGSDGRISMWEINLRVVGDHWLFGTGPGGYAAYYMTYFPHDARSTHNNHLDIIAQFGILGAIVWFWLSLAGLREGWRLIKQTPPGLLHVLAVTITTGWICAQVAMFFGDWVLPFVYNQTITGFKYTVYTWIWLGMLISIRTILTRQQTQENVSNTQR